MIMAQTVIETSTGSCFVNGEVFIKFKKTNFDQMQNYLQRRFFSRDHTESMQLY